ncbi:Protein LTV1 [Serendipita indica DSM 11827]|nr:Protein LTV1 [Serendipita indica DSM 11827]
MPPKSIFRQPGARNFQLVHRSQRDPLIHDPEASTHVLKEFERKNAKGKGVPQDQDTDSQTGAQRAPGEAALYGIYYDDREYDYTQHLRTVGVEERGVDSILIEAPLRPERRGKKNAVFDLIPKEALPSEKEIAPNYESQQAIPSALTGFQPDMDPHLRQTLEALDDEAFVDEGLEDDFFGQLLADGEREEDEVVEYEFHEDGLIDASSKEVEAQDPEDWQNRFAKFKLEQKSRIDNGSVMDGASEGGDTLARLPSLSVAGAKKRRRKGTSDASGYSMSSSSMFRNEGLTRLDEQFERFEAEYELNEEEEAFISDGDSDSDSDSAPDLITTREDFEAVLDEFLAQEQVGKKLQPRLEGGTPQEKLNTLRRALVGEDDRELELKRRQALLDREDRDDRPMPMPVDIDQQKERWDCETILSTYSNLENHPRFIKLTQSKNVKRIRLDAKTGLPTLEETKIDEESEASSDEELPMKVTTTRPKNESAEEKKARKQAVKQERQERRKEKQSTKDTFSNERKQQKKALSTREKGGVRKL